MRPLMEQMGGVFLHALRLECGSGSSPSANSSSGGGGAEATLVVHLNVVSADPTLDWNTDEGYALDLRSTGRMVYNRSM